MSLPPRKVEFSRQRSDPDSFTTLSDADRDRIRVEARKKVADELRAREEKELLDQYTAEERRKMVPDCELVQLWLTLANSQPYVMLDGSYYFHEHVYQVTPAVFATLLEQQARGWAHEELTHVSDAKSGRYNHPPAHIGAANFMGERQPRNLRVSAGQLQGASAEAILGARG